MSFLETDAQLNYVLGPDSIASHLTVVDMTGAGLAADSDFDPPARGCYIYPITAGDLTVRALHDTADATMTIPTGQLIFLPLALTAVRATGSSAFRGQVWAFG